MSYLPFISDEKLIECVKAIFRETTQSDDDAFFKNSVDPFSAVFDAARQNIPLVEWQALEIMRQGQKTLQNRLGEFHQSVLGSMNGWENLKTGHLLDLKNAEKRIVAEIKNKHNTVKGSDKVVIYQALKHAISTDYENYTGYYVEVIPKNRTTYDEPFTPSDNVSKVRVENNPFIRRIDGVSFYALASGYKNALRMLYEALPALIQDVMNLPTKKISSDALFLELFEKTF